MEMIHEARIIPLDGRPHVSDGIRQWLGDSRGHWDGDTLVVETTRFNSKLDGGDYQPSHIIQTGHRGPGGTMRLVERFRIVGANTIDYQFTVEDPRTFTRPYTVAIPMTRRDTSDPLNYLFEYACHEGNHAMVNLLAGARANEEGALELAAIVSKQRKDAGHPGVREPAVPFVPAEKWMHNVRTPVSGRRMSQSRLQSCRSTLTMAAVMVSVTLVASASARELGQ